MKSVAWYHCTSSGLVLSAIRFFSDFRVRVGLGCGVMDRYIYNIPVPPLRFPYTTGLNFSSHLIFLAANVAIEP